MQIFPVKMDVTGIPLTPQLIQGYLLELVEPGKPYKRGELIQLVKEQHLKVGGVLAQADLIGQVKHALQELRKDGRIGKPTTGYWQIPSGGPTGKTIHHEGEPIRKPVEYKAEVTIGDGVHKIYGWYYPSYRKLAALEGKDQFPIRVVRTNHDAEEQFRKSSRAMAAELPVLGFVAHVDDSGTWERFIHSSLALDGRKLEDAVGKGWFNTNLEELHEVVSLKMARIGRAKQEQSSVVKETEQQAETDMGTCH